MRISDWSSDVCSSDLIVKSDMIFGELIGFGDGFQRVLEARRGIAAADLMAKRINVDFPWFVVAAMRARQLVDAALNRPQREIVVMVAQDALIHLDRAVKDRKSTRLNSSH